MKYQTINKAAKAWVREFNAFPTDMIAELWENSPDDWEELTMPCYGNKVFIYDSGDTGEICDYNSESDLYSIILSSDEVITCTQNDFEVECDSLLPIWGTVWQFHDGLDDWWLEQDDGIVKMSRLGFRIYRHSEWGYFFGIDGAGYDFYEAHWIPLYKVRGLQWHNEDLTE